MLRNRIYYGAKPFVPQRARMAIRRQLAMRRRPKVADVWPIMPGSERPPPDWPGWPEGKKFAVVLTHDVEGQIGLDNCRALMQHEMDRGFRSSFNFIPEGTYNTPRKLREELVANDFEVGVHDLRHNGRLYRSRAEFVAKAQRINSYLEDWGAVGFRSGFMLHNLDWLHALEITYDASTFDTDPFEPQPEGRHTIFPFWIPGPGAAEGRPKTDDTGQKSSVLRPPSSEFSLSEFESPASPAAALRQPFSDSPRSPLSTFNSEGNREQPSNFCVSASQPFSVSREGYVELPYTLPQDSTLFLLLREQTIDLWLRKVDWLAENGGMLLLDTHPDYMAMTGMGSTHQYPIRFYTELLEYIRSRYEGQYWHVLPKQVADWVSTSVRKRNPAGDPGRPSPRSAPRRQPKVWIDLDNTPHVPFFEPIVEELQARGFPVLITARDAFQVCDLADKKGFHYAKIGRHHGRNPALKAAGLVYRSLQLAPTILREKPLLAVSHGARSQLLLSNWLGISTVLIEDYEYCEFPMMMRPSWVMAPAVIPEKMLPIRNGKLRKYEGIKEDVYAWKLRPDRGLLNELGLSEADLVVTVRPPATEAHYHNPESELFFERFMVRAINTAGMKIVLLPRNQKQTAAIRSRWPSWFSDGKTVIPSGAIDGLNLLWHSDLVVSGGGTMNREAAALGVPVYSIFRGVIGAVDRNLSAQGRLILIESPADVENKIELVKRPRRTVNEVTSRRTLSEIVDSIEEIAEFCRRRISPVRVL